MFMIICTQTALLKVMNNLLVASDNRLASVRVVLELSLTFDSINHKTLLQRLEHVI